MRILSVFLLLLNLLFGVWQYCYPQQTSAIVGSLPTHVKTIQLMREQTDARGRGSAGGAESGLLPAAYLCHTLGPFADSKMIDELKGQLQEFTRHLSVRVFEESEPYRYWVYLVAKNNDDAIEISRSLVQQGVSDYFIMTSKGEKRVSLGHFKEKTYADKRIKQVSQLGFAVKDEVILRSNKLYWLDYEILETQKIRVDELIAPYLHAEISLLNRSCEE